MDTRDTRTLRAELNDDSTRATVPPRPSEYEQICAILHYS